MLSDLYLKSLKDRLKVLDNKKAEKQLNQWIYNYLVHSKGYNSIFSRNLPTFIKIFNSLYISFIKILS